MSEEKTTVVEETKDTAVAEKKNGWLKNFIWLMMGVIIGIVLGKIVSVFLIVVFQMNNHLPLGILLMHH